MVSAESIDSMTAYVSSRTVIVMEARALVVDTKSGVPRERAGTV